MHCKVIACEVLFRETCYCAASSPNTHDLHFVTQGYHDNPDVGRQNLQESIDRAEKEKYGAVLLGYGLCSNLTMGLAAREVPLVIPKGHDCITVLLGSKERYAEYFGKHPGTYFYSAGWLEYRSRGGERVEHSQKSGLGASQSYQDLVEKHGEENAKYIMEVMGGWTQHYTHGALIDFEFQAALDTEAKVRDICEKNGWEFTRIEGDLSLTRRWLDGDWNENDFLVLQPGQEIRATGDEQVMGCRYCVSGSAAQP